MARTLTARAANILLHLILGTALAATAGLLLLLELVHGIPVRATIGWATAIALAGILLAYTVRGARSR